MVGAAGLEPATLCLAADPTFLQGLDYIFGIAAALLIVSEDSPAGNAPRAGLPADCPVARAPRHAFSSASAVSWATSGFQHTAASSIRVHFPGCAPNLKADALSPELRARRVQYSRTAESQKLEVR